MASYGHSHQNFPPEFGVGPAVVLGGPSPGSNVTSPPPHGKDDLQSELAAMHAIGVALGQLTDPETRSRVLRWAKDRFDRDLQAAAPTQTAPPSRPTAETTAPHEPAGSGPAVVIHVGSAEPTRLLTSSASSVQSAQPPVTEAPAGDSSPASRLADPPMDKVPAALAQPAVKAPPVSAPPLAKEATTAAQPVVDGLTVSAQATKALTLSDESVGSELTTAAQTATWPFSLRRSRPPVEKSATATRTPIFEDPLAVPTLAALDAMALGGDQPDPTAEDPLAVPSLATIEALTSPGLVDPTGEDQLSVSNLDEFFGQRYPRPVMRLATGGLPPNVGSSHARPNGASAEVGDLFSRDEEPPAQAAAAAKPGQVAAPTPSVAEMLHDLAADFQQMVDEWHSSSRDP